MRDIRTPADPQDFESSLSRTAPPPREFRVAVGSGQTTFSVTDQQSSQARGPTASYRIYFVPGSYGTLTTVTKRTAALRVAKIAAEVPAGGRGAVLSATDTKYAGQAGHYICVAVNQRGKESVPAHFVQVSQ